MFWYLFLANLGHKCFGEVESKVVFIVEDLIFNPIARPRPNKEPHTFYFLEEVCSFCQHLKVCCTFRMYSDALNHFVSPTDVPTDIGQNGLFDSFPAIPTTYDLLGLARWV